MTGFNLLTEDWIPVQKQGQFETISLKHLLCNDEDWQICLSRDDMEMAALQLIVCIVQVVFMPDDEDDLLDAYSKPMSEADYEKGRLPFMEWFDLLHPKYPFMQCADVKAKDGNSKGQTPKNWTSFQKLFIGLPEITSDSPSSKAFFNTVDEINNAFYGEIAIAIFQQATNGFSLGGSKFAVGLKGSMPLTTLIHAKNLRKSIWANVINKDYLHQNTSLLDGNKNINPSWVVLPSFDKNKPENAQSIGLLRGLFWQPAKIKLVIDENQQLSGFLTEPGMSYFEGFWKHPHTPIDEIAFKENKSSKKPFLSLRREYPVWTEMLSYFYTKNPSQEGASRALVVSHYEQTIGRGKPINLVVGGYVKGGSQESLAARKHELYGISSGWENQIAEMNLLISYGLDAQKALDYAVYSFGKELNEIRIVRNKEQESNLIKKLKEKTKKHYFAGSEPVFHSIMRDLDANDVSNYKKHFVQLAMDTFDTIFLPYEHDPKLLKAIVAGRRTLTRNLMKIGENN